MQDDNDRWAEAARELDRHLRQALGGTAVRTRGGATRRTKGAVRARGGVRRGPAGSGPGDAPQPGGRPIRVVVEVPSGAEAPAESEIRQRLGLGEGALDTYYLTPGKPWLTRGPRELDPGDDDSERGEQDRAVLANLGPDYVLLAEPGERPEWCPAETELRP